MNNRFLREAYQGMTTESRIGKTSDWRPGEKTWVATFVDANVDPTTLCKNVIEISGKIIALDKQIEDLQTRRTALVTQLETLIRPPEERSGRKSKRGSSQKKKT